MPIAVRRATSRDADCVTSLYLRARKAAAEARAIPPTIHTDVETAHWVGSHLIPKLECWVAETSSSQTVGMLVLDEDWIDQLYVEPGLTRRGIGLKLLEVAKQQRPNGLQLWTFVSNRGARRFYRANGFVEIESTDGSRNEEGFPDIRCAWEPG
jgi:GNAT superfamily N-acetyltransferase